MDTRSAYNLSRIYRSLQSSFYLCNFTLSSLSIILLTSSAIDLGSYEIARDVDWLVRGGYLIGSAAACGVSIVSGGAELKSNHDALIASFGIGIFVAVIMSCSLALSTLEVETIPRVIDSALEAAFRENEFRIKVEGLRDYIEIIPARAMKKYKCCGWYSSEEFHSNNSYPNACCKVSSTVLIKAWTGECTAAKKFTESCYKNLVGLFFEDLIALNKLAMIILPLSLCTAILSYFLAGFCQDTF